MAAFPLRKSKPAKRGCHEDAGSRIDHPRLRAGGRGRLPQTQRGVDRPLLRARAERRTGPCRSAEKHIGQRRPGFFRRLQRADRRLLRPGRARRTRVRSGENGGYGICPGSRNRAAPAGEDHRRGSAHPAPPASIWKPTHMLAPRHPALRVDGFSPYPAGAHRVPSAYARADVYMELFLEQSAAKPAGTYYRSLSNPAATTSIDTAFPRSPNTWGFACGRIHARKTGARIAQDCSPSARAVL